MTFTKCGVYKYKEIIGLSACDAFIEEMIIRRFIMVSMGYHKVLFSIFDLLLRSNNF